MSNPFRNTEQSAEQPNRQQLVNPFRTPTEQPTGQQQSTNPFRGGSTTQSADTSIPTVAKETARSLARGTYSLPGTMAGGLTRAVAGIYKSFPQMIPLLPMMAMFVTKDFKQSKVLTDMIGEEAYKHTSKLAEKAEEYTKFDNLPKFLVPKSEYSWTPGQKVAYSITKGAEVIPQMAMAGVIMATTGQPMAAAGVLGVSEAGNFHKEAIDNGATDFQAGISLIGSAVALTWLENLAFTSWMKPTKGIKGSLGLSKLFRVGKQAFTEGAEESLQEGSKNLLAKYVGWDKTRDLMQGVVESFFPAMIAGGTMGMFQGPSLKERVDYVKTKVPEGTIDKVIPDILKGMTDGFGISNEIVGKYTEFLVTGNKKVLAGIDRNALAKLVENKVTAVIETTQNVTDEAGKSTQVTSEKPVSPLDYMSPDRTKLVKAIKKVAPGVKIKLSKNKSIQLIWDELDPSIQEVVLQELKKDAEETGGKLKLTVSHLGNIFNNRLTNTAFWSGAKKDIDTDTVVWFRGQNLPLTDVGDILVSEGKNETDTNFLALRYGYDHAKGTSASLREAFTKVMNKKRSLGIVEEAVAEEVPTKKMPEKSIAAIKKLVDKYGLKQVRGTEDRNIAVVVQDHFTELPKDVQDFLSTLEGIDLEGEASETGVPTTVTPAEIGFRGTHWIALNELVEPEPQTTQTFGEALETGKKMLEQEKVDVKIHSVEGVKAEPVEIPESAQEHQEIAQGKGEVEKKQWGRYSDGGYEVSSAGDKRFSAMFARLNDGRTIEEAYQQAKGSGKGQPSKKKNFDYWGTYLGLWKTWARENPRLIDELARLSKGKTLTDKFASTNNNQARALAQIINEKQQLTDIWNKAQGKGEGVQEHQEIAQDKAPQEKIDAVDTEGYLQPEKETVNVYYQLKDIIGDLWNYIETKDYNGLMENITPLQHERLQQLPDLAAQISALFTEGEPVEVSIDKKLAEYQIEKKLYKIQQDYIELAEGYEYTGKSKSKGLKTGQTRAKGIRKALTPDQKSNLIDIATKEMRNLIKDHPSLERKVKYKIEKIRQALAGEKQLRVFTVNKTTKIKDAKGGTQNIAPNQSYTIIPEGKFVRIKDGGNFLTTQKIVNALFESGDFIEAQDGDVMGGGQTGVPDQTGNYHPPVGLDGKDAYKYTRLQKSVLNLMKGRGWNERWIQENAPKFLKDFLEPVPNKAVRGLMNQVATEFLKTKRVEIFYHLLGLKSLDIIHRGVEEEVARQGLKGTAAKHRVKIYKQLMNFMNEEVGHNEGESIKTFYLTENGKGYKYKDQGQREDITKHLKIFCGELGIPYDPAWDTVRPKLAFTSLAPAYLRNMVIWTKAEIENPMLQSMIKAGLLNNADIFKKAQQGFTHRAWTKQEHQKGSSYHTLISSPYQPKAKYDTYAEFVEHTGEVDEKGVDLIPLNDYAVSISDYIRESLTSVYQQETLNVFKQITNPYVDGMKMVEYEHNWKTNPKGWTPQKWLTQYRYRKINTAPGLAHWHKGSYRVPWVPDYIADVVENIYRPGSDSFRWWLKLNGFVKRIVMPTPYLFYLQILSTPILYKPSLLLKYGTTELTGAGMGAGLGFLAGGPIGAAIGGTAGALLGDPKGALGAIKGGVKDISKLKVGKGATKIVAAALPKIMREGLRLSSQIWNGKENVFSQVEGMPAEKVALYSKHGIPSFAFNFLSASFFDKAEMKHAAERNKWESGWEIATTKFGMDSYVFNHLIPKMVFETVDNFYEKFRKSGQDPDRAAANACKLVGDLTGVLESNIFGKEGKILQGLLFARNFTMSFARQVTGATYSIPIMGKDFGWKGLMGHYYATSGGRSYANALFHGEANERQMKDLHKFYVQHLVKVMFTRLAMINFLQFALSYYDDDKDKHGSFAWNNEKGKKLSIQLPNSTEFQKRGLPPGIDARGMRLYIEPLMWRESTQFVDLLGHFAFGQGRGPWQLLRSKMNYGVNMATTLLNNHDIFGNEIIAEGAKIGENMMNVGKHGAFAALPSFTRPDVKKPEMFWLSQLIGSPFRRGRIPDEKGITIREAEAWDRIKARDRYLTGEEQEEMNLASPEKLLEMYEKGQISFEQYRSRTDPMKQKYPISLDMMKNQLGILKRQYRRK